MVGIKNYLKVVLTNGDSLEIRKSTANRLFENIEFQEAVIDEEVAKWMDNPEKMQELVGYNWILEQFKVSCI